MRASSPTRSAQRSRQMRIRSNRLPIVSPRLRLAAACLVMSVLTACAHSAPEKAVPPKNAESKPVVKLARDCEYLLKEVDPAELRKVDVRVLMAEDDSALDIANQRIKAALFC